jgi:di/tricarboxylate transporter
MTLVAVAAMLGLLVRGRTAPALVVLGADILLLVVGVLDPAQALAGFSNPAPFTVAALYVVARAVEKTGGLQPPLGAVLGRDDQSPRDRAALARLLLPVAGASAFLNNTPIVAMVAPQVEAWAQRRGRSPSRLLMPLSFAAILGGTITVIGTSTNIVVSGLLQSAGEPGMGMFEITRIGLPVALGGLLLLVGTAPLLLPDRRGALKEFQEGFREYTVNMVVLPGGPLEGRTVEEAGLRHLEGVFLAEVRRKREVIAPASPNTHLRGGDLLTFVGRSDLVLDLSGVRGLASAEENHALEFQDPGHTYFEAVVGADSPLRGKTLRQVDFRSEYRAAVLAIHRAGERVRAKLGDIELEAGDTLILLAGESFQALWRHRRDFLVISRLGGTPPGSTRQALVVGAVLLVIVGSAAAGILPILQGSLMGALLLVINRVMSPREALDSVDLNVIILIASSFGVGEAILHSGLAGSLAQGIVGVFGDLGPRGALLGILLTTIVLTEVITNNAAAVLVFPLAVAVAEGAGLAVRPFAMAIAIGASASFLTPIGYQTNTMVYGPGGYRFGDFARLGLPLTVLIVVLTVWLVPWFWSFA